MSELENRSEQEIINYKMKIDSLNKMLMEEKQPLK